MSEPRIKAYFDLLENAIFKNLDPYKNETDRKTLIDNRRKDREQEQMDKADNRAYTYKD